MNNNENEAKKEKFVINFDYDNDSKTSPEESPTTSEADEKTVDSDEFLPGPDDALSTKSEEYIDSEDDYDKSVYFEELDDDDDELVLDDDDDISEEELKRIKKEERKKKKLKKAKRRKARKKARKLSVNLGVSLILTTLILGVSIVLAIGTIVVGMDFAGMNKSSKENKFIVYEGDNAKDISQRLADEGYISFPWAFRIVSRLSGADALYQAGEHYISADMAYEGLIETLTDFPYGDNPELETVSVTFREGITLIEAAELLEYNGVCDADDFIYAFNSTNYGYKFEESITSSSLKFYKKEGFFFPDTYTFYLDESPEIVCTKILSRFDELFVPEYYDRLEELDMTIDELITLASVIQGEANSIDSMQKCSSVFHNRLNNPSVFPKLQSDATSNYVDNVILVNAQYASDTMCNAYDTYESAGLPPGAICNPGIDAIEAALYPADTDYYYFYTDDMGVFHYANTYDEHLGNINSSGTAAVE
ncbi:MAG: endolytic transglycosylase MltG [Oscillospiraceae bacterium]|nr:endolytic transglycosylase MltG [Oscillospiraceae bacterium]